jgi:myo-inositol-1(or 4)-monophosphatase
VAHLLGAVGDIRRLGSAALDLCLTAAGRVDAYVEEHLNLWDVAAGLLIAEEAGAQVSDFAGGPARPEQLLVAAPALHAELRRLLSWRDLSTQ